MEVIEDQYDWSSSRQFSQESHYALEQEVTVAEHVSAGIELCGGPVLFVGHEARELMPFLAQRLDERLVGSDGLLGASTEQDNGAVTFGYEEAQLCNEPRLSDARFAGNEDAGTVTGRSPSPRVKQRGELRIARNERGSPSGGERGGNRLRADRRFPWHLAHQDRIGQPFEIAEPERHNGVGVARDQRADCVVGEDLVLLSQRAQPSRLDHRRPEPVAVDGRRLAHAQTDTDAGRPCRGSTLSCCDRLLHRDRACDRHSRALVRHHQSIAEVLDDLAACVASGRRE